MKVHQHERQFRTRGGLHVTDITDEVADDRAASRASSTGSAAVYSPHTTCCVRVNEFESGFFEDFAALLRRLIPRDTYYAHDDWDRRTENICEEDMEIGNGHAHCMSMMLGSAGESIPVADGELAARHLAAGALHRARPRARPPLDRQGRRLLAAARPRPPRPRYDRPDVPIYLLIPHHPARDPVPVLGLLLFLGTLPRRALHASRSSVAGEDRLHAKQFQKVSQARDREAEPGARERDAQAPARRPEPRPARSPAGALAASSATEQQAYVDTRASRASRARCRRPPNRQRRRQQQRMSGHAEAARRRHAQEAPASAAAEAPARLLGRASLVSRSPCRGAAVSDSAISSSAWFERSTTPAMRRKPWTMPS